jgi:putative endonuclease
MEVTKNYMILYTVYAIRSSVDRRVYVGFTKNLGKRLIEHNQGSTKSTKGFKPWSLIYYENVETRIEARKKEKYFKSGCGKEFLKSILAL